MQEIKFSENEENYYNFLFVKSKSNLDFITPQEVANLLTKSGLDKVKLKEIWDLSNVRKAPHLTRIEFFSACRYVALSQNNQALNLNNLLVFNNNNKFFPKFEGIQYNLPFLNQKEKPKIIFDDDFEEYSCDNSLQKSIPNKNNKSDNKSLEIKCLKSEVEFKNKLEDKGESVKTDNKAKIKENEIKMLDSMMIEQKNKNISLNDINKNDKNPNLQQSSNVAVMNNTTNELKNQNKIGSLDSLLKMLDSINVETPASSDKLTTNSTTTTNTITTNQVLNQANIKENNLKIEDDEFEEFEEHKEENNTQKTKTINLNNLNFNHTINNPIPNFAPINTMNKQYIPPNIDNKPKNEKFDISSLLNDFSKTTKNEEISTNQEVKINENKETKQEFHSASMNPNTVFKMDIIDLFENMEFNYESDPKDKLDTVNTGANVNSTASNTTIAIDTNNKEIKEEKDIPVVDDMEFFEFEENSHPNQDNTNLNSVNIANGCSLPTSTVNVYEDNTFSKELEEYKKEVILKTSKEEKNNILNYTPNDFLRDFMNESKKKENLKKEPLEDENNRQKNLEIIKNEIKNNLQNTFEGIVNQNLNERTMRNLFYKNTIRILNKINQEFKTINLYLNELSSMDLSKEEEDALRQNKRFTNFIEGSVQIIIIFNNINFTYENIIQLEEYKNEGLEKFKTEKIKKKISVFTAVSKKFIFEDRIIDLITNTTKFKTDMSISNSICNLCFTELKESISTNIFLHDFHINCINFWINFVDQHSPYQL